MHPDIEVIHKIREGDDQAYKLVYAQYFGMVRYLVVNNRGNEEDARDVFHDAMITILEKSAEAGFELSSSLKTYLYSVARNIWYSRARKLNQHDRLRDYEEYVETQSTSIEEKQLTESQLTLIEACLERLGDPCKSLLTQFYYLKVSMQDIAEKLGYQNADHAKSQKYKCLQRLKKLAVNEG